MHSQSHRGTASRLFSLSLGLGMLFQPTVFALAAADTATGSPTASTPLIGTPVVATSQPSAPIVATAGAGGAFVPLALRSILVFPTSNESGAAADTASVAAKVDEAIHNRLTTIGRYKVTYFSPHLAAVDRALGDRVLSADDLAGPFNDSSKAGRIANEVSTDGYLIINVEAYTWDATTRKAELEVAADVYNTSTSDHLKGFTLSGHGAPETANDDQTTVTQMAIDSVANQIVRNLNASAPPTVVMKSQIGHANPNTPLYVILGGALLYALIHKSGSGGGGTTSAPSPPTGTTGGSGGGGTSGGGPPAPPL